LCKMTETERLSYWIFLYDTWSLRIKKIKKNLNLELTLIKIIYEQTVSKSVQAIVISHPENLVSEIEKNIHKKPLDIQGI